MKTITLTTCLLLLAVTQWGCKDTEPPPEAETTLYYDMPEFNGVRKAITLTDGATVYVGSVGQDPAVLILEPDFSLRHCKKYSNYGPGDFFNVIQRDNGNIGIVGVTEAGIFGASWTNRNGCYVEMTDQGDIVETYGNQGEPDPPASPLHDAFTSVYEDENNDIIMGRTRFDNSGCALVKKGVNAFSINFQPLNEYIHAIGPGLGSNYFYVGELHVSSVNSGLFAGQFKSDLTAIIDTPYLPQSTRNNWRDASPFASPFMRAEIIEGTGPNNCFVATMVASNPYVIGMYLLNKSIKFGQTPTSLYGLNGLGQTVFQNSGSIGDDMFIVGSTVGANETFEEAKYSAYIASIQREPFDVLWETYIAEEGSATTALTAKEMTDHIQVSGLILDASKNARFVQWTLDKEGNLQE